MGLLRVPKTGDVVKQLVELWKVSQIVSLTPFLS